MVALLVLLTFAVFIGIDILLNREKYIFRAEGAVPERIPAPVVAGVQLPEHLHYHLGHTWAVRESSHRFRVGIDEFAARLMGGITKVEAPMRGRWFGQGERGWTLHAGDRQASLAAPVEGEVVEVNQDALAHPEKVASDPYGAGWLLVVRTADPALNVRNLLSGAVARRWMEDAVTELRQALSPASLPTAADGGLLAGDFASRLDLEEWETLKARFFRL
jgi:glycine cleavage system H lipoate-binding protein